MFSFWVKFFLLFFPVINEYSNRKNKLTFIFCQQFPNASFSLFNTLLFYFFWGCWSCFFNYYKKEIYLSLKRFLELCLITRLRSFVKFDPYNFSSHPSSYAKQKSNESVSVFIEILYQLSGKKTELLEKIISTGKNR